MGEGATAEFTRAVERVASGESVVVIAESEDGSASQLVDLIPGEIEVHSRLVCAPVCWATVGGVAEELEIEEFRGGAVILEDAQWADPTSLGRLQRLVGEETGPLLLVIAHRPLSGVDGWWLEQLAGAARKHAELVELSLDSKESLLPDEDLDPRSTELIVASRLLTGPISVPIAATLLGLDESAVLELGNQLVAGGWLQQARGGFMAVTEVSSRFAGEARIGYVAAKLAAALEDTGGPLAVIGGLREAAGQPAEAFPVLAEAAKDAENRHAAGEAFQLAEAALRTAKEAGVTDAQALGALHLICARFLRSAGRTEWAGTHLEMATSLLAGRARVDALRLAATVADDSQRPQTAERIVAAAEWEAAQAGETSELGSLLTLRARVLNRIGFAEEAEATLSKGQALLAEGSTPQQRFAATQNKAWIHFDRGEVGLAEVEFTRLRDAAGQLEGDASVADKEAWRARALFVSGHPDEALQAIRVVEELAAVEDVEAPVFLAQLALTEGNLAFGRFDDALSASERVLDLVERQLPAWENMARSHRANVFLRRGSVPEARAEITRALAATPSGSDGWRWRVRCLALQMEIDAQGGKPWREDESEDLVDLMLQSRFYGWAAELLCVMAERGKRGGAAAEAAAVATHAGLPMVAARAINAGSLWGDPVAIPVILAVRAIEKRVPSAWEAEWRALPHVAAALEAPEPTADEESAAATTAMEEALRKAGLAGEDVVLSPAQRRTRGLVRRSRALRPLRIVAAALGVVVLAAGTALGVAQLTQEDAISPPTTTPEVAVTEAPALEETQVAVAADVRSFFGTVGHRGGYGRGGSVEYQGPRSVSGYYWRVRTAGPIEAAPIAFGRYLYVGTTEGTVYALDQTTGDEIWTMTPEGRVSAAPAMGEAVIGEGTNPMMVVVVDDDGVVRGHRADTDAGGTWVTHLGARIRSSPVVVDGLVWVATTEGFIHELDLVSGEELSRYPEGDVGLGPISADLAYHDGLLYAGSQEGILHVLDVSSGIPGPVCEFDALQPILSNPIVVDDIVYVPTRGQNIWTLPAGRCDGTVPGRLPFYVTETPVEVAPAIVGDIIYLPDGQYLYSRDLTTNEFLWPPAKVKADSPISAPPVVAGDVVVFASEDGVVHAVDATDGEALWTWRTGLHVRGSPAVIDGVVFVVSGDGFVYALGA